jgi:hypothetical protein
MSRIHFQTRTILSTATLAAALLGTACSDSTAPSAGESSAGRSPATQLPTDTTGTSAGSHEQLPAPEPGEAPKVNWPAPGDSAAAAPSAVSFLRRTTAWIDPRYATQPGLVSIPTGAAICLSSNGSRILTVQGMVITLTGGLSALYPQSTTANVWFYRWNGSSWVYQAVAQVSTAMDLSAKLPPAYFFPNTGGYYRVMVRFTQYANMNGWVKTAVTTYDFDGSAEYQANLGVGAGYCRM